MAFAEGDEVVISKSGRLLDGVVAFVEDGYLSVRLPNGAEMDFTRPFDGVTLKSAHLVSEGRSPDVVATLQAMDDRIVQLAQLVHRQATASVRALGGSAAAWHDLTPLQQMNFVGAATGVPVETWVERHRAGEMSIGVLEAIMMAGSRVQAAR